MSDALTEAAESLAAWAHGLPAEADRLSGISPRTVILLRITLGLLEVDGETARRLADGFADGFADLRSACVSAAESADRLLAVVEEIRKITAREPQ